MARNNIYSGGTWKVGNLPTTVVTDDEDGFEDKSSGHSDIEYYGGCLIAESILKPADARLIASAPILLESVRQVLETVSEKRKLTPDFIKILEGIYNDALGNGNNGDKQRRA